MFRSILKISLIAYVILSAPALLFPQVKIPVVEDIPDVGLNTAEISEKYKAKVTLYGKEPLLGEIVLNTGASITPSGDRERIYQFSNISRITVSMWSRQRKGSGWIFYPESYEIILKDGTRVVHSGNLEFLNRIRFAGHGGRTVYLYTYYYDYFKGGMWVNTGTPGEKTAPSRPADGCLYIIELK